MATIKDVAKKAGVAVSTASIALNGNSKVSPSTREKVLAAAKELNYQKNGFAMDLKKSRTKTIALILSDLSGPYYSELIKGVQQVALAHGYDLIACSSLGGEESTAIKFLKEKRVDGVIILAHNIGNEVILESARPDFPVIVLDRILQGEWIIHVGVDNVSGGFMATEYLIKNGHKNIAFVSGSIPSYDNALRREGYLKALEKYGIDEQRRWNLNGNFTREGGYHATKMLIMQQQLPDAVFYANDEMAIGGLQALKEAGIRVPQDISVIGFDDIQLAEYVHPPLTTIKQPKFEVGTLATNLLFQALTGDFVKNEYLLSIDLVERDSCRTS